MRALVVILILILAALVPALALAGGDRGPSPVVFPPQRVPLAFSHAQHVGGLALPCVECHVDAATSRSAIDRLTPTEAPCRRCHAIARPTVAPVATATATGACAACHVDHVDGAAVARVMIAPPAIKFSHAAHAATACVACHAAAATATSTITTHALPVMDTCARCHGDAIARRACTTCHLATAGGRIRTELPDGVLAPRGGVTGAAHGADFANDHAAIARSAPAACASCHQERDCTDCHQGAIRAMEFHPAGYLAVHAVDVRRGSDCSTCHRTQSFCVACHERSGVAMRGDTDFRAGDPDRAFHPLGWASIDRTGSNLHARAARAGLDSCTSCHREDTCLRCHSAAVAGPRISPHGPAWRGSSRCRALASRNGRMCLRCHIQLTPVSCDQ